MSFLQTEKGKLGAGILGAVLITAAILVPVSIFTDRAVREDSTNKDAIKVYSYKADTSTSEKALNKMLGINAPTDIDGDGKISGTDTVMYLSERNSSFNEILEDNQMMDGVTSSQGIGFGNESAIGSVWADGGKGKKLEVTDGDLSLYEQNQFKGVLNLNMKVTKDAANTLREHLVTGAAAQLSITDFGDYGSEIISQNPSQFALAFTFFNYVTFAANANNDIEEAGNDKILDGSSVKGTQTIEQIAFNTWASTTFGGEEWLTLPTEQTEVELLVDGSSTPDLAMSSYVEGFNTELKEAGVNVTIAEELNNNGSGSSWAPSKDTNIPGGPAADASEPGSATTYLGTSSSLQKPKENEDGEMSGAYMKWGYEEDALKTTVVDELEYADSTALSNPDAVLESTISLENPPVFFTSSDLKVTNFETGKEETPTGITKVGLVDAYVYGASWTDLSLTGNLSF